MDDELTRARRALRSTDGEFDPDTGYTAARSRSMPRAPHPSSGDTDTALVEVATVHTIPPVRRRRVLVPVSLAACALFATLLVLATPGRDRSPGPPDVPAASAPAPSPSAPGLADITQRLGPVLGSGDLCLVRTSPSLDAGDAAPGSPEDHDPRVDRVRVSDRATPAVPLDRDPVSALTAVAVNALRDLGDGTPDLAQAPGSVSTRSADIVIVTAYASHQPLGGQVSRVEYIVDTATWLPRQVTVTAVSDLGQHYRLVSEVEWLSCDTEG